MIYLLRNLVFDLREFGPRAAVWNARFLIGQAILPGQHAHITVCDSEKDCVFEALSEGMKWGYL